MIGRPRILGCLLVFLAVGAVYAPAIGGLRIWDDDAHITRAGLLSLSGLRRIWLDPGATQQYYPVLHTAFWVEHHLWGGSVAGYHLSNVLLHALAACLFAFALGWLKTVGPDGAAAGPAEPDWLAGLLFALHPVCVESVAWISEQKNTLSTVLYLLAALAFLSWREEGGPGGRRRPGLYLAATGLFVLALLTKSVTATLPAVIAVGLWWRQGRLGWRRDVLPLGPWLALAGAAGCVTVWVERRFVGASGAAFTLTAADRLQVAGRALWFYAGKLAWPFHLAFIYPRWTLGGAPGAAYVYPVAALALAGVLWAIRGRSRGPLAAALAFAGGLFPALGFFNVYPFLFSFVADHWQYLASLGAFALASAGLREIPRVAPVRLRGVAWAGIAALLAVLATLSWRQARLYRDPETLYRATLRENPGCWLAHDELGNLLMAEGRLDEAKEHYLAAAELEPANAQAHNNLGVIHHRRGELKEAADQFRKALRLRPDSGGTHLNLGDIASESGNYGEAVSEYLEAARLNPDLAPDARNKAARAHYALGVGLAGAGRLPEAEQEYRLALELAPDFASAHANLGGALANLGRVDEAVLELEAACRLAPADAAVQENLGLALRLAGREAEAQARLAEAERLRRSP